MQRGRIWLTVLRLVLYLTAAITRRVPMRIFATCTRFAALLAAGIAATIGAAHAGGQGDDQSRVDRLAQVAELEQLHATFHAGVSVHDPVNGDSPEVITRRIRQVLSIWAEDGEITIINASATAGN